MIERKVAAAPALPAGAVPGHVAVIADDVLRWARERGLSAADAYRAGAEALAEAVRAASAAGVAVLTVLALPWRAGDAGAHAPAEAAALVATLAMRESRRLRAAGVRVRALGPVGDLAPEARETLRALEARTATGGGLVLNLAVGYGSHVELGAAARALAHDVRAGLLSPDAIDEETLGRYLFTAHVPDPDLVITTGGDVRAADFLVYQSAYAELWSTPLPWPEVDARTFDEAFRVFAGRQRRFGG